MGNSIVFHAPNAPPTTLSQKIMLSPDLRPACRRRRAFTLTELLVVMGVIGVLSVLTMVGVRRISKDARLALGTNTVVAALDEARALAIRTHNDVLVAFVANLDGSGNQVVEVILAEWTGDTFVNDNPPSEFDDRIDRFLPVAGASVRRLPKGISVASPNYHRSQTYEDDIWRPVTYLPWVDPTNGEGELIGQPPGVMFAADGSRVLRNSHSDSSRSWVDFNNDGLVQRDGIGQTPQEVGLNYRREFEQRYADDETLISLSVILAVYDLDEALENKTTEWALSYENAAFYQNFKDELAGPDGYITARGNRIHFNRYSGVVMR
ncbi:MAG: prepilin-type N-terminal cleavage/methylation domain-containing protein [Planctomycetota bacterium]